MNESAELVLARRIERSILLVRGQNIMLDDALADVYGVKTARLNQQRKRNVDRFPARFAFQLTSEEVEHLRLQNATTNSSIVRTLPMGIHRRWLSNCIWCIEYSTSHCRKHRYPRNNGAHAARRTCRRLDREAGDGKAYANI